jgi:signal transduction histidine kinase
MSDTSQDGSGQSDLVSQERQRIAGLLHQTFAQDLSYISLTARRSLNGEQTAQAMSAIGELADSLTASLRTILLDLRHPAEEPLRETLSRLIRPIAKRWDAQLIVDVEVELEASLEQKVILGRIMREAVTNAVRHGRARSVRLSAQRKKTGVRVVLQDDGVGFDPVAARRPDALGIDEMRNAVDSIGGTLRIDSAPGRGTSVTVEIP